MNKTFGKFFNRRLLSAVTACLLAPVFSAHSAEPPVAPKAAMAPAAKHTNKVDYISVDMGSEMIAFKGLYPDVTEKYSGNFIELEKKSALEKTLFSFKRPREKKIFDRFARQITAKFHASSGPERCNYPSEAVSLGTGQEKKITDNLYAYSFLVCSEDSTVAPVRMLDKYIEKYGAYDVKDWDRDQHIYFKVKDRYKVMVKPVKTAANIAALLITVVDEDVFDRAYFDARARLRNAENATKGKF